MDAQSSASSRDGEAHAANDATALRRSAVVGKPAMPGMSQEEHKRRGDLADALFQEMKREIAVQRGPTAWTDFAISVIT